MSLKHYVKSFSGFAIIGIIFYGLAVALNWLVIDKLNAPPASGAFSVMTLLFLFKYHCYLWINTIQPAFWRYVASNLLITAASTYCIALLIETYGFSGASSSALILAGFMIFRYYALWKFKVIQRP